MEHGYITTKDDLVNAFVEVGIRPGMSVMVHAAMSVLGYVVNGALDLIDALIELLGDEGTLLMPAHSGQLTDPADWRNPPIPVDYVDTVRRFMRQFDPQTTPVRNRGIIAQTFLSYPDVHRSLHPLNSVSAKGARAVYFTEIHEFHDSEGLKSPTGRLYEKNGHVLLIGLGLASCTAIHLSEFIADVPYLSDSSVKVLVADKEGKNKFVRLRRYPNTSEFFDKLVPDLLREGILSKIAFRNDHLIFFPLKPVVDIAVEYLRKDPHYLISP